MEHTENWDRILELGIKYDFSNIVLMMFDKEININNAIQCASKKNRIEIFKLIFDQGSKIWSKIFQKIFDENNATLIYQITKNNPWHMVLGMALNNASENGNLSIVEFLLDKGLETKHLINAFNSACKKGHIHIFKLLLHILKMKFDENEYDRFDRYDRYRMHDDSIFDKGFVLACANDHILIVKLLIENGIEAYDDGLTTACENNHLDVVELLIDNFLFKKHIIDDVFLSASFEGKLSVLNLILNKISIKIKSKLSWKTALDNACFGGHLDVIYLLIENNARNWNSALNSACLKGHRHVVDLLIRRGANNWTEAFKYACVGGDINIVKLMIEKGADNWNWGLRKASSKGHLDIVELMIENGANNFITGVKKACLAGHLDVVKLLASNINNSSSLKNVLKYAQIGEYIEIIDFAIKSGIC